MTTEPSLHERLAALADQAPPGGPMADLWDRGRRYQRRRRGGTALIVGLTAVVLLAVVGTVWTRMPDDVQVATPSDALGLPDRLYEPSPWLPGTDETGPIGPVVAVMGGEDASWSNSSNAVVGVSRTGEYAILDLPDLAGTAPDSVAVSPDGRYVAYWFTGETAGEPNRLDVQGLALPVVGVAVYDTTTGDVRRDAVPTEHGLSVEGLAFGGSTVWFAFGQYDTAEPADASDISSSGLTTVAWDLTTDARTQRPTSPPLAITTSAGDALAFTNGQRLTELTVDGRSAERPRFDVPVETQVAVSPSGERWAALRDTDGSVGQVPLSKPEPVVVATSNGRGGLVTTPVPGQEASAVVGWRDDDHVVVLRYGSDGGYFSVDVGSGASTRLFDLNRVMWEPGLMIPQNGWQAPQFDAPAPAQPMNPRTATLVAAGTMLAGLVALVLWRRRRVRA